MINSKFQCKVKNCWKQLQQFWRQILERREFRIFFGKKRSFYSKKDQTKYNKLNKDFMIETQRKRRLSHCTSNLGQKNPPQVTTLCQKRSSILSQSNKDLFQGLLHMTKQQSTITLEENRSKRSKGSILNLQLAIGQKKGENPFHMAKTKLKIKNEENSLKTSSSSRKEQNRNVLRQLSEYSPNIVLDDLQTITMKQVNEKQRGRKRQILKCLTDR